MPIVLNGRVRNTVPSIKIYDSWGKVRGVLLLVLVFENNECLKLVLIATIVLKYWNILRKFGIEKIAILALPKIVADVGIETRGWLSWHYYLFDNETRPRRVDVAVFFKM